MKKKIFFKICNSKLWKGPLMDYKPWRTSKDEMMVKCWCVLGWRKHNPKCGWDSTRPRGRSAWELEGTKTTQTENHQEEQCLVSISQPLPTLTQTPASQKWPGHLPPGNMVDVGWSQRDKAGSSTHQKLEHPCHKTSHAHLPVPTCQPSPSLFTPIPLFS